MRGATMSDKPLVVKKPSFMEFDREVKKLYSTHVDLNLSKDTLIEELYEKFFVEYTCPHDWKVAGVTSHMNEIKDTRTDGTFYYKSEAVVVTSLYCSRCAEIKQETKYT